MVTKRSAAQERANDYFFRITIFIRSLCVGMVFVRLIAKYLYSVLWMPSTKATPRSLSSSLGVDSPSSGTSRTMTSSNIL